MRIEITRSGGFGGLTRTWSLEVSRTEAEQRWLPLAEAAADEGAGGAPSDGSAAGGGAGPRGPGPARDRFTYRIAIGYTEVDLPESRLGDPWRELIDRARAAGTDDGAGTSTGLHDAGPARSSSADPGKPEELL